jgi:hypothetical protein
MSTEQQEAYITDGEALVADRRLSRHGALSIRSGRASAVGNRWMVSRAAFTRWLETCGEVPASTPGAKEE